MKNQPSPAVYNFSAGPAMIPQAVLATAQQALLNWQENGCSVMEMSHRSPAFMAMITQAEQDLRRLYGIPNNYKVLFLQGGARGQFSAIPMNLLDRNQKALYLNTGHWSHLAACEARTFGDIDELDLLTNQGDRVSVAMPDLRETAKHYAYVHYCPNETIGGVELFTPPDVGDAVLVADMSSCILSREIDFQRFGLIYAGAQKNLGPAGITLVIIREDLLQTPKQPTPSIWNYVLQSQKDSMINTPPTFAWYLCALVFNYWLNNGGLPAIALQNQQKAALLYDFLDNSTLFKNTVDPKYRSEMNVPFSTGNTDLDTQFIASAKAVGLLALKGHKVQGGMRASIYNAMPLAGVEKLVAFMREFEQAQAQA